MIDVELLTQLLVQRRPELGLEENKPLVAAIVSAVEAYEKWTDDRRHLAYLEEMDGLRKQSAEAA